MARILLLIPTNSYKARSFLVAAERLGAEVVVACEHRAALESQTAGRTLTVDFACPDRAARRIVEAAESTPFDGIVGTDDESVVTAAAASRELGLRHNSPESVKRSRDKHATRVALRDAGLRTPWFQAVDLSDDPERLAEGLGYPCVVKPLFLSGSRGVLRADESASFVAAFRRAGAILADPNAVRRDGGGARTLLVEGYLPGIEIALEGILEGGVLRPFAILDKPDTPVGPTFEETLLVTPSRLAPSMQRAVIDEVQAGCRALGLTEGPVHAELRVDDGVPWILEVAARTIGGLCSRMLRFATGRTLEEVVLGHLLNLEAADRPATGGATGVFMIPVPRAGRLVRVDGVDGAIEIPGIDEVTLTIAEGSDVLPLPEGHQYVGFVFASGGSPAEVEDSLRAARGRLAVIVA